tara:strand:+ start:405 stop:518 length:114 start_codon:yes stop_codon:yes gene_type:complete
MDKNKDKRISKNEFTGYIKKYGKAVAEDDALKVIKHS